MTIDEAIERAEWLVEAGGMISGVGKVKAFDTKAVIRSVLTSSPIITSVKPEDSSDAQAQPSLVDMARAELERLRDAKERGLSFEQYEKEMGKG